MSRSGRIPITIPENTEIKIEDGVIFAKGKLGELSFSFKNDAKSHCFFDRFLDAILIPKWLQNGSPNHLKTFQKSVSFFDRFFIDFWIDLGGRNP